MKTKCVFLVINHNITTTKKEKPLPIKLGLDALNFFSRVSILYLFKESIYNRHST